MVPTSIWIYSSIKFASFPNNFGKFGTGFGGGGGGGGSGVYSTGGGF